MTIESLEYVRIAHPDPQEWAQTGEEVLGFQAVATADGSVALRMDEAPFRFLIEKADSCGLICAGWACDPATFDDLIAGLEAGGIALQHGDAAACSRRAVDAFVSLADPSGNQLELCRGRSPGGAFVSPLGQRFITGEMGLGHLVLPAMAHVETCRFYERSLGFDLSDDLILPPPADGQPEMRIRFLHAANPRHHSVALFNGPAPSGVVHLMVELTSLDEVGACLDRVNAAALPITASLGRHVNDGMVSFYFLAPGGIPMEVGYDGKQFDWRDFKPTYSTVGDHWGHVYNFPT